MDFRGIHQKIADDVSEIARGMCWCIKCKRKQVVNGAECLRHGWPICCGQTMTIDSPQKRAALAKKRHHERDGHGRMGRAS